MHDGGLVHMQGSSVGAARKDAQAGLQGPELTESSRMPSDLEPGVSKVRQEAEATPHRPCPSLQERVFELERAPTRVLRAAGGHHLLDVRVRAGCDGFAAEVEAGRPAVGGPGPRGRGAVQDLYGVEGQAHSQGGHPFSTRMPERVHRNRQAALLMNSQDRIQRRHAGAHSLAEEESHDVTIPAGYLLADDDLQRQAAGLRMARPFACPVDAVVIRDGDQVQPRNPGRQVHYFRRCVPTVGEGGVDVRIADSHAHHASGFSRAEGVDRLLRVGGEWPAVGGRRTDEGYLAQVAESFGLREYAAAAASALKVGASSPVLAAVSLRPRSWASAGRKYPIRGIPNTS